jgi:hypothetical protein
MTPFLIVHIYLSRPEANTTNDHKSRLTRTTPNEYELHKRMGGGQTGFPIGVVYKEWNGSIFHVYVRLR